jgi:hypothetical protein
MPSAPPSVADAPVEWDHGLLKVLYGLLFSAPDRELAGVLVGVPPEGSHAGLPLVRAAIPATQGFIPGRAALFVHQTWAQVHQAMARHYQGLETVGWYVSRPGQGTGLTEVDVLNHRRWFSRPDQVLFVADSISHRAAVYAWASGRLVQVTEGPVAPRYTQPPRLRFPVAWISLLTVPGFALGAIAFIVAQALGG